MIGFEPGSSCIESDHTVNCDTTNAPVVNLTKDSTILNHDSWVVVFYGPFPAFFLYFRLFNTVDSKMFNIIFLPMMGFEPQTSGIGSDCSTNWATTTSPTTLELNLLQISRHYNCMIVVRLWNCPHISGTIKFYNILQNCHFILFFVWLVHQTFAAIKIKIWIIEPPKSFSFFLLTVACSSSQPAGPRTPFLASTVKRLFRVDPPRRQSLPRRAGRAEPAAARGGDRRLDAASSLSTTTWEREREREKESVCLCEQERLR